MDLFRVENADPDIILGYCGQAQQYIMRQPITEHLYTTEYESSVFISCIRSFTSKTMHHRNGKNDLEPAIPESIVRGVPGALLCHSLRGSWRGCQSETIYHTSGIRRVCQNMFMIGELQDISYARGGVIDRKIGR